MADKRISELDAATTLDGTELVPVVQGGATVQTTLTDVVALATASIPIPADNDGSNVDLRSTANMLITAASGSAGVELRPGAQAIYIYSANCNIDMVGDSMTVAADGAITLDAVDGTRIQLNSSITDPLGLGQMVFLLTSNTNLRVSVRGSDGTVRSADLTLS